MRAQALQIRVYQNIGERRDRRRTRTPAISKSGSRRERFRNHVSIGHWFTRYHLGSLQVAAPQA